MPLLSDHRAPPASTGREHLDEPGHGPARSSAGSGIPSSTCPHLRGLRRASLCCGGEVYHPYRRSDEAACRRCGRAVETHAVLNSDGERIWPVPAGFVAPAAAPPALPQPDPEAWPEPFPVHLPAHLKRIRIHIPR